MTANEQPRILRNVQSQAIADAGQDAINAILTLVDRAEAAEAALASQRGVVKTLAERNVELTKFKDAYSLQAQELEAAEAAVQRVRELASEYRKTIPEEVLHSVMVDICRTLDGGEQE